MTSMSSDSAAADIWSGLKQVRTWWLLGRNDVMLKYRRSFIGPLWITLTLIVFAFSMGLLYGQVFNQPFAEYVTYLVCGLTVWYLLQAYILESSSLVIEAGPILQNMPIKLSVFAARVVVRNIIIFMHNLLACAFVLLVLRNDITITVLYILPALLIYAAFGFGLCLLFGPISARYRDIPPAIASITQLLFFLSPIIWPPTLINPTTPAIRFNPLFHLIELARAPLLGHAPTNENWAFAMAATAFILLLGYLSYSLTRHRIFYWL